MADIKLNVSGDASGGKRAMSEAAQSVDKLSDATKGLGGSLNQLGDQERSQLNQLNVLKAGSAVGAAAVKIGADCVQAFAAAERVTLQLGRAAGSLSGVFEAQADALESQLHVDGELIKQQQTLLLQWGAAPRAIEPTIRAIEDYAAATGKDALTATTELIKGVETGGAKFKALGITYEHTGDKTKDLANLTAALSEKFAGANKANSDSLAGRLEYASIAFDNVKESFGGLIGAMESKLGILEKASGVLQSLARGVSGGQSTTVLGQINDFMRNFTAEGLLQHAVIGIAGSQLQTPDVPNAPATFGNSKTAEGEEKNKKAETEAKQHAAAMKKIYDDNAENQRKFLKDIEEMDDNAAAKERENWADDLEMSAKRVEMDLKEARERVEIREKMRADIDKGNAEHAERQAKEEKKAKEDAAKQATKDAREQAEATKAAADQIGAAFVNGLTAQLAKLAEGGEFDVALFIGDLLAVAFSAAATVIGTAYGMPALGAAVGNLGATGIRFGASEISKQNKQSKYHDGGWVGAPRHHEGAFIGSDEQRAILQTGERVLSRDEVRGMGGPSAVDKMAKGSRSGININISAIDTKGVAQSFMGDGSRGLKRALKSGRGDLPSLLGGDAPMSSGYSLANALKNYGATSFTWSSAYTLARTRMNDGVQDELALSAATPQASGQSLVLDFAVAQALVGIAILNHNLASGAVSVLIEAADNAAITTNAVVVKAASTINTAAPYQKDTVLQFPVVTKRYWRLTFTHTGTKVISIGELIAIPSITVLSRQTVYGAGDSERFIQNRNESDIGTARAVHLSGPIRTKTLTFKDLKGVSQRDELLSMWRNSFGGVVPILYIDVIESTATAATSAAQQCLWGRLQDSVAWTEDDYLVFNVDTVVIQGMGREVGMTFATDASQATIGRVIRVDFSFDKFATITHRFGTAAGVLDGVNQYSSRILSMGNISRGFGESRVAASGNTSIVLDNSDGALDSLAGRDNIANHSKLRARIYVCLFDPAAPGSLTTKQLGEFSLQAWPRRDNSTITLDLADDVIGAVSQLSPLPSIYDWFQVGTAANNPIKGGFGLPDVLDTNNPPLSERGAAQIQLAFGEDWVLAMPHILPEDGFAAIDPKYQNKLIVPVCCTTDLSDGYDYEISELRIYFSQSRAARGIGGNASAPEWFTLPRTTPGKSVPDPDGTIPPFTIWRTERSPIITKNGKSFRIIYLVVDAALGLFAEYGTSYSWLNGWQIFNDSVEAEAAQENVYTYENAGNEFNGGYPRADVRRMRGYANNNPRIPQYASVGSGVYQWWVKGAPLSARSFPGPVQHPCDVLADLVLYYSNATAPTVDPVSQYRVKTSNSQAACAGVVQPWTDRANRDSVTGFNAPPSLRQVMTKLCQSSDIDIFINWLGQFAFSGDQRDYETSLYQTGNVLPDFPRTNSSGMEEWLPSDGERYSIFNRLFLAGGRTLPPEGKDVPFAGPWDFGGVGPLGLSLTDRVVENTLEIGWRPYRQQALNPINNRQLDVVARSKVKFRVGLRGLTLDLGDYFTLTWTRNLGGPYLKTAFKVESLSYAPADDEVEIEGIWRDDVITERVYLLDDESFRIRSKNVGGGTAKAYPVGASDTCTFDAGLDLSAMGVQAGDMLVLLDASEPLNEFNANQVFRINNVLSATALTVAGGGFNDPMPSPQIEPTEWQIYRGATTDPTSVSDPVLYPDGASMFGKVTDASGNYSNTAQGNRLING